MPNLQITAIAFAVGVVVGGGGAWKVLSTMYEAEVAKQKVEAAAMLQSATERAIAAERANIRLADKVEVDHAAAKTKIDRIAADNRRLARELGGLRDPGRRDDCSGSVPTTPNGPSKPTNAPPGARLSAAASEFLLEFAKRADSAAEYAQACYRWANEVAKETPK